TLGGTFPFGALPTSGSGGRLAKGGDADNRAARDALNGGAVPGRPDSGGEDTDAVLIASAAAGAAGVLLVGLGLAWWRRRGSGVAG
ncbi:hypothetical protein ACQKIP_34295, partial [Streptomyces sp. NPDC059900]